MKRVLRKCKTVGFIVVVLVILEAFLFITKWDTKKDHSSGSSSINYKYFLQIPGEQTDWRNAAQVYKVPEFSNKKYLTIGIPTVRRTNSSYFFECFDNLLQCSGYSVNDIVFVIFLADFNVTWKTEMAEKIQRKYTTLVEDGTVHVIQSQQDFYPKLNNLKHTFNDSESRTKWRSKQNVDFAFMWLYSVYLGEFYMQIEDDVSTIPGYIDIIKQFISEQKKDWTCLEFSQMGFIGKVFHSYDLELLAKTILLFYDKQPVDFLFRYFNIMNLQGNRIIRKPTLFRHNGFHSSLPGKKMEAVDTYFDNSEKTIKGDNPPARLFTTMRVVPEFPLENAYSLNEGYFWAHSRPIKNDVIGVVFNEPQSVQQIYVITGSREHKYDILEHGSLEICLNDPEKQSTMHAQCSNTRSIASFENGTAHVKDVDRVTNGIIQGLQIKVTQNQNFWLIVKEIAVFIKR